MQPHITASARILLASRASVGALGEPTIRVSFVAGFLQAV
jgi:hypothetical protein